MRGIGRVRRQSLVLAGLMLVTMALATNSHAGGETMALTGNTVSIAHHPRPRLVRPARHRHSGAASKPAATVSKPAATAGKHGPPLVSLSCTTARHEGAVKLRTVSCRAPVARARQQAPAADASLLIVAPALPARGSPGFPSSRHPWFARIPGVAHSVLEYPAAAHRRPTATARHRRAPAAKRAAGHPYAGR